MDPHALITPITQIVRDMASDQPVERAATLEEVRAEVLTPERLNTLVFGGMAGVALAIAVVGVAGVLAFSVSGRTREFGIRLAVGAQPRHLLLGVIAEGAVMAVNRCSCRCGDWVRIDTPGEPLFSIAADADRVAARRVGGRSAGRRGHRVSISGGARRAG